MSMPAGRYYIGDLCYVMHDVWPEVCDLMFPPGEAFGIYGEHTLKDGRRFSVQRTAYGDGVYMDNQCRKYPVDAGIIGCILQSDITDEEAKNQHLGNTVDIPYNFETAYLAGTICIGDVEIDTDPQYEDWDEETWGDE